MIKEINDNVPRVRSIRKSNFTKRRQKIDLLLKKAIKGDNKAKKLLQKEFGIRLYSPKDKEEYQKEN